MGLYLITVFSFLGIMLLLSQLFYPGGYFFLDNYISDQGWVKNNPVGCWFFIIGASISGILLIPYVIYLYKHLMTTCKPLTHLFLISALIGCIGFSFVGLIPKDFPDPHDIAADLAFGGLGVSAFLSLFILLRKVQKRESWPKFYQVFVIYSTMILVVSLALIFQNTNLNPLTLDVDPRWTTWPPWQWINFFNVIFWLISLYLIIPDDSIKQ